jgi:L-ribulose-5-phosphate 3-epimerase
MLIGITQLCLRDMSLDEVLAFCKEAEYECVELAFQPGGDPDSEGDDDHVREARAKCEAAGIVIGSTIMTGADRGSILSPDPAEREKRIRGMKRATEIGEILDCDCSLVHPGQLEAAGQYDVAYQWVVDAFKECAPMAEQHKTCLAIENVWNKFILSPTEARDFVDAVGSPYVGFYLDIGNMVTYGYPEHWIRILGDGVAKVHFKDFHRREHKFVPLQEGDVDWPEVMSALREIGYDGPVISEVGGDLDAHKDTAQRMKQIVAL